jgi:hypothetical protein
VGQTTAGNVTDEIIEKYFAEQNITEQNIDQSVIGGIYLDSERSGGWFSLLDRAFVPWAHKDFGGPQMVDCSHSGRGAAWLARLLGVQEVPGSNPGGPTK